MLELYNDIEHPVIFVLYEMEKNGVLVDSFDLKDYSNTLDEIIKKLEKESVKIAKYEARVNPQFDMEAAIRKEQEIKAKVEQGELTPEEALKAVVYRLIKNMTNRIIRDKS